MLHVNDLILNELVITIPFLCASSKAAISSGQSRFSSGSQVLSVSAYPFHFKKYSVLKKQNYKTKQQKYLKFNGICKCNIRITKYCVFSPFHWQFSFSTPFRRSIHLVDLLSICSLCLDSVK